MDHNSPCLLGLYHLLDQKKKSFSLWMERDPLYMQQRF
uniref:Uncharacterized protein n=1 Tax=Rhizophora mucronata TaxID=61149 RepID=A0A2P2MYF3_RHIMU